MSYVEIYVLFALSVGLLVCIDLLPEVRRRLFESNRLDDPMYANPFIAFSILLIISALTAPLVVFTVFVSSLREVAIRELVKQV